MCKKKGKKTDCCSDARPLGQVIKDLNKQEEVPASGKKKKSIVGHRRKDTRDRDRRVTIR